MYHFMIIYGEPPEQEDSVRPEERFLRYVLATLLVLAILSAGAVLLYLLTAR